MTSRGLLILADATVAASEFMHHHLPLLPIDIQVTENVASAESLLATQRFQAVLCDGTPGGEGGREILHFLQRESLPVPLIILSGEAGEETVEGWLQAGAFDVIMKPIEPRSLLASLRRALLWGGLISEAMSPRPLELSRPTFPDLVGNSEALQTILGRIAKIAASETTVCIYGESGTGKELVARGPEA